MRDGRNDDRVRHRDGHASAHPGREALAAGATPAQGRPAPSQAPEPRAGIEAELARVGVTGDVQAELARRLEPLVRTLDAHAWDAALAGVALAHGLHREHEQALARSLRDLAHVQRLLGAFAEEMEKLDEALALLTAHVKRLRVRTRRPARPPRVVH